MRTGHVAFCFTALDPLPSLVPPVVLVGQDHVHVHVVVGRGVQHAEAEAQEGEHPPVDTQRDLSSDTHRF